MRKLIERLFALFTRRERTAEKQAKRLERLVRTHQRALYKSVEAQIIGFDFSVQGSRLTPGNIALSNTIAARSAAEWNTKKQSLADRVFTGAKRLFGINSEHFSLLSPQGAAAALTAEAKVLSVYGLGQNGTLAPGSYLDGILTAPVKNMVAQQMNAALARPDITLAQFRDQFKAAFLGQGRQGMLEAHFQRFTNDLFMQIDRQAQIEAATALGLNHFVYAGTAVKDSRPHCLERLNLVYTLQEERKWENQTWKGKIPGVPVALQMGGYNCRHSRMFVSAEIALFIANDTGFPINSYR